MPHAPLQPGDCLQGRYTITRVHRLSGLGALYEARDTQAPQDAPPCAVKETIIRGSGKSRAKAIDEFKHKAKLLLTLDHPTISETFDYFVLEDRTYLVMEFVRGKDLEDILFEARQPLPVAEVLQWAIRLCEALEYLHTLEPEPIIFCDLKPSNVIIDRQNQARLVDFGIAVVLSDPQGIYEPLGTDGYAAPEQYDGQISPAVDIYALGAILHHLLTHHDPRLEPPFSFDKRPIREINSSVPEALEAIIARALADHPDNRFPSAAGMLAALKQVGAIV